ncbi:hypothetical protein KC363_g68 [Hortaea werneckii]|nr:hypothetical protein KC363_g68 [Hortaea werneckii]
MGLICLPTVLNPLVACWVRSMGVMRDGWARNMLAARKRVDCIFGGLFVSEWRGSSEPDSPAHPHPISGTLARTMRLLPYHVRRRLHHLLLPAGLR